LPQIDPRVVPVFHRSPGTAPASIRIRRRRDRVWRCLAGLFRFPSVIRRPPPLGCRGGLVARRRPIGWTPDAPPGLAPSAWPGAACTGTASG